MLGSILLGGHSVFVPVHDDSELAATCIQNSGARFILVEGKSLRYILKIKGRLKAVKKVLVLAESTKPSEDPFIESIFEVIKRVVKKKGPRKQSFIRDFKQIERNGGSKVTTDALETTAEGSDFNQFEKPEELTAKLMENYCSTVYVRHLTELMLICYERVGLSCWQVTTGLGASMTHGVKVTHCNMANVLAEIHDGHIREYEDIVANRKSHRQVLYGEDLQTYR